jgi:hypothetical protein
MSSEASAGLASPKSNTPRVRSALFWRSSARSPQFHGVALSEAAASDREQSVLGTLLPTNNDKRCRNGVAGSRRQIEVYSRTPGRVGPVPLPVRRRASKIGRLLSPQVSSAGGSDVVTSAEFLEKAAQEVPNCMALRCRSCPFRMGAIRTGDALPTNGDNNTGTRRRLATANRSLCSRPRKLWGGSLSCPKEAVENR